MTTAIDVLGALFIVGGLLCVACALAVVCLVAFGRDEDTSHPTVQYGVIVPRKRERVTNETA